jgi:hypothetical protein
VAPPAAFTITPPSFSYGTVFIGSSAVNRFTVTNNGGQASPVPQFAFSGTNAGEFSLTMNGCAASLAPMGSCAVDITFAPTTTGDKSANVTASGASASPSTATLAGTAAQPAQITLAPATGHDFGASPVGQPGSEVSFTVGNAGSFATGAPAFTIAGGTGDFLVRNESCQSAIPPQGSCNVTVTFVPGSPGDKTGQLVAMASPGGSAMAPLQGHGTMTQTFDASPPPDDAGPIVDTGGGTAASAPR